MDELPDGLTSALERLYAMEVNVSLTSFWDGGWTVKIGDHANGFKVEFDSDDLGKIAAWLATETDKLEAAHG